MSTFQSDSEKYKQSSSCLFFRTHFSCIRISYLSGSSMAKRQTSFKFRFEIVHLKPKSKLLIKLLVNVLTPVLNSMVAISFNLEKTGALQFLGIIIFCFTSFLFLWPSKEEDREGRLSIWEFAIFLALYTHKYTEKTQNILF